MNTIDPKVLKLSNLAKNVDVKSSDANYLPAVTQICIETFVNNELFIKNGGSFEIIRIFKNYDTVTIKFEITDFCTASSSDYAGFTIDDIWFKFENLTEISFLINIKKYIEYIEQHDDKTLHGVLPHLD